MDASYGVGVTFSGSASTGIEVGMLSHQPSPSRVGVGVDVMKVIFSSLPPSPMDELKKEKREKIVINNIVNTIPRVLFVILFFMRS
jgi:hypothetical protein